MWTGQEMTLADGLMISAVGLLVVFAALAALAIAVIIISKIINTAVKDKAPKQAAVAAAQSARKPDCREKSSVLQASKSCKVK